MRTPMKQWLKDHSQNMIIAAVVTSVLAAIVSIGSAVVSYELGKMSQDRQAKIEQVSKFESSNGQIIAAGGQFIAAINSNKELDSAKLKLSTVVATQIHESESLRGIFDSKVNASVTDYQTALLELNSVAQKTTSSVEMRLWAESFGRALDAKSNLSQQLNNAVGIQSNSRHTAGSNESQETASLR
jgi:hypothetical protein